MASGVIILPHREVPFSVANFHALRVGAPLRGAKETQSLVLLEQGGIEVQQQRERDKAARVREYEGRCGDAAFRFWQWVALGLAVIFIATVVVMIAVICICLNETFEAVQSLSGSSPAEASSLNQIVAHAVQSAANVNEATANMVRATHGARARDGGDGRPAAAARDERDGGHRRRPARLLLPPAVDREHGRGHARGSEES